jgi:hypothetical protein
MRYRRSQTARRPSGSAYTGLIFRLVPQIRGHTRRLPSAGQQKGGQYSACYTSLILPQVVQCILKHRGSLVNARFFPEGPTRLPSQLIPGQAFHRRIHELDEVDAELESIIENYSRPRFSRPSICPAARHMGNPRYTLTRRTGSINITLGYS